MLHRPAVPAPVAPGGYSAANLDALAQQTDLLTYAPSWRAQQRSTTIYPGISIN